MNELGESLKRFLEFHDTSQVSIVRTQPKKLKDALIRELNRLGELKS
jgi:hypothetical protein